MHMRDYCRFGLAVALAAALCLSTDPAIGGQFKRLNASVLAAGAQISAFASPQNQGAAMEMDVYEYLSAAASYRCRILRNATGRTLNLRRIGVNGTVGASCAAPPLGTCDLPFASHGGNLLFQCIVATQNGAPVVAGAQYVVAVQRGPAALEAESGSDQEVRPTASGLGPAAP
jgi:hypothetical protein